jgi:hypothetical protein
MLVAATALGGAADPVRATAPTTEAGSAGWLPPVDGSWLVALLRALEAGDEASSADERESPRAGTGGDSMALRPRPKPGAFSMNLASRGDFVHQQTVYWCVAAAVQTMMNIADDGRPNRSRAYQRRLHFQGRDLDRDGDGYWRRLAGASRWRQGLHGLGLTDWAELLNVNGYGPYAIDRAQTRRQAIRMAARAVRLMGRPAGLVVWRGAHAWVMSGFSATDDPALTNDFEVRSVVISDPWYPFVSTIWGVSRPPNSSVPVAALAEDYVRYDRPGRRHPMRDGRFMLILPSASRGAEVQQDARPAVGR